LNAGDPIALTRLPPELADAAVAQWEQALRLAQQTATYEDNAARAHLEQLRRDTELRSHSVELREKEWDLAARVRERALADAREQVNFQPSNTEDDRLRGENEQPRSELCLWFPLDESARYRTPVIVALGSSPASCNRHRQGTKCGNHTHCFFETLACDRTCECWGFVGTPQDTRPSPNRRPFPPLSHRINVLTPISCPFGSRG
jgi:hypothetical protein